MPKFTWLLLWCIGLFGNAVADGPADNQVGSVRPMPPPGVAISPEDRKALENELTSLKKAIESLRISKEKIVQEYLPDVEIFARAVELAIAEDGFFEPKDVDRAKDVLKEGASRAKELGSLQVPWIVDPQPGHPATKQVVRGFRSKLDGTVQPYGIVINQAHLHASPIRADVWCRGRSEKGLELQFIATRMNSSDPLPAPGTMMIHPFGRYCNANKLAGEVDTLEAIEHALANYNIDPKRIAIRGFSMGGAAAWHLAVHYPDKWFAANPGAGFSETPDFLKVFQSEDLKPAWYEQTLWQMYDCPVWAGNLRMLPTIAYSGELDKQKQAADMMAAACWNLPPEQRFELTHIIAPKTAHQVAPVARAEIEKRLATLDALRDKQSKSIQFVTTTLKYNKYRNLTVLGLASHWKPASVVMDVDNEKGLVNLKVENVTELALEFEAGKFPKGQAVYIASPFSPEELGAQAYITVQSRSDLTWGLRLRREGSKWVQVSPIEPPNNQLVKKHDLQGPIDDALMGPFMFVKPSGTGRNPAIDQWVEAEMKHAIREWHRQMRGDVRIKSSEELTPADIENYHLILWGDPQSNPTLGKIADKLPILWNKDHVVVGPKTFDATTHAPILIYPNPLNPERYVVLNSSFTYREYDYLNNARQVPKLPDWAIVDISVSPNARWPGKIADADFFGERWELKSR